MDLATHLVSRTIELQPRELSSIAWAMAKMLYSDEPLRDAISLEAQPRLAQFEAQNLVNTLWALATQRISDAPLLDSIAAPALRSIS